MTIAPWLLPVLWREHDWRAALGRLATELVKSPPGAQASRSAVELGRAFEYVEPDRRRAIAAYEIGGDPLRARALAVELGWWSARARLSVAARSAPGAQLGPLALDEAEAWWDAGQPDLCGLALAGVRGDPPRRADLAALLAGRNHFVDARTRAALASGVEAADLHVMAARFARAAKHGDDVVACLEAALAVSPGHAPAARGLLALALASPDPKRIERCLQLRVAGLDAAARIDGLRSCALALIASAHHRGFGLRVLRQALELAYDGRATTIPGHLAMWSVLVEHASADGTRRELLPLVIRAIQASQAEVDRVWLGALATEISLRDAHNPVVAGAYAEIVAEHAPDHPIVGELVAAVAAADAAAVPAAATAAAHEMSSDVAIDLDDLYAGVAEAAATVPDAEEITALQTQELRVLQTTTQEIEVIQVLDERSAPLAKPGGKPAPKPPRKAPTKPPPAKVAAPPAPAPAAAAPKPPAPKAIPKITPPMGKPVAPAPATRPSVATFAKPVSGSMPPLSRAVPVLAALRTADRPVLPPRPATRADALPRARRISIPIDVTLVLADGARIAGHSRDISTTGLFVLAAASLAIGAELTIELLLPGAEAFTEDEYRCRARVARRAEGGYGIELIGADAKLLAALAAL